MMKKSRDPSFNNKIEDMIRNQANLEEHIK
jgi:hypothetical protein